ncbi:2'-5' RNA ligase family protein [Luteimonas sp. RD2P54]|uniref:2'-5' RNA ligase family protein n=1 Tax=Luteimonas endophytica TaxID=3042023 RepID=A0ABT6J7U2_9GAMM|nr:2'-5' RNA ligase family protein [Luteimonas endophytica]MDH5822814.1 2'-5' RNA ligase family protein [Luteimonas endophytica]
MSGALFPAWRPDAGGLERFGALLAGLQAARPAEAPRPQPRRPDQWHATLCFLGHRAAPQLPSALLEALAEAAARVPAHRFGLGRIAYWPGSGAVVALPRECRALQALCDATRDAALRCGIRPEKATSQPHVTLAYLDRHLPAQPWLDDIDCRGDDLRVDGFELLFNAGGRYQALAGWPLTGTALPTEPAQARLF